MDLAVSCTHYQDGVRKLTGCKGTCSSWICFIRTLTGRELGICKLSSPLLANGARVEGLRIIQGLTRMNIQ